MSCNNPSDTAAWMRERPEPWIAFNTMAAQVEESRQRLEALVEERTSKLRAAEESLVRRENLATILGLLPLALGFGEGAELRAPLAITVIGGLSMAPLLTLVVIPVVYLVMDRKPDPVLAQTAAPSWPAIESPAAGVIGTSS